MGSCLLTERQKNMIRSLAPGLRDGTVKKMWNTSSGAGDKIRTIFGITPELRAKEWKDVDQSDFEAFIKCEFFTRELVLNEGLIFQAIERNFEDAPPQNTSPTTNVNISGGDFRGAILNIASKLTDVQQSIGSASQLSDDTKAQLMQLVGELRETLANAQVSDDDADEAEVLAKHVETAIEQVHKEKLNKKQLSISIDGLEKAAQNIGRVAPRVMEIGAKIALILRPFIGQ